VPTGVAPNGRYYAGDANLFQDLAAAAADLAQTVDVAILRVGETGLQIIKYGTGEFRMTGAVRTDGILRALGGLYAGAFTTTERDAIGANLAPYGLIILNTTTAQFEWNAGTDGSRSWQPLVTVPSGEPAGIIKAYGGAAAPTGHLLCDGSAVSRSTYSALFSAIGVGYGPGNGSTTFNLPDGRGRTLVGLGAHADVNTLGNNDGITLGNRSPRHNSTNNLTLPNHIHSHSLTLPNHTHTHSFALPAHVHSHTLTLPQHTHALLHNVISSNSSEGFAASGGGYGHDADTGGVNILPISITGSISNPTSAPAIDGAVGNPSSLPSIGGAVGNPTTNPAIGGSIGPGGSLPIDMPAFLVTNFIITTG
jgi:microcystin-dependent protein